ncbi:F-box/LRR-repeat protein 6 [Acanthochromis polyacanthus]|uniref:F-box/LRR-repeat protein 6 n=1 Tax=Acanthochromis polyacanthus TaxID=80966 RepID=UPI0022348440|nr:F-box/LRR-repeat protein 6 [Acanthochromis polyacanthus]
MEASEAEASTQSDRKEDTVPSVQGQDGPESKKVSLKRTGNTKAKKTKKPRVSRTFRPGYTVHEGEDMLLVISSSTSQYNYSAWVPKKRGRKKKAAGGKLKGTQVKTKKAVRAKPKLENEPVTKEEEVVDLSVPQRKGDHRWGQSLPEELLINIFKMVVDQEGAVPFLCRAGRVCRLWNVAASSPVLWHRVTVGHCWIAPGRKQLPQTEMKVKDTLSWLAEHRFSQLRDFSLCHWTKNVDFTLETVSQFCPHLRSLKLSHCGGVTAKGFSSLGLHSRSLQSLNLQYSEFNALGFLAYLHGHGSQIKQILFTHGPKNDRLLTAITRGCCPDLELLEVNSELDSKDCELPFCIRALQVSCPKLKTFRMLNVRPRPKAIHTSTDFLSGFPLLEELCIATTHDCYMRDKDLQDILFDSPKLQVLDLRGCLRITPAGLAMLPCLELECLFWGQYFSPHLSTSPVKGLHLVTQKWSQTLRQLDIANRPFPEKDLELAMSHLAQAAEADTLQSLNLSGTKITPQALRSVVGQATALDYLNLSSCRYLPRGAKRIYRGQEDIRQLLDKLV